MVSNLRLLITKNLTSHLLTTSLISQTMHCMIILNAPGFFSVFWGILKQIIDPRTAKRIQVYSNKKKAFARLAELIDDSNIPSNYGGSGSSLEKCMEDFGDLGDENKRKV